MLYLLIQILNIVQQFILDELQNRLDKVFKSFHNQLNVTANNCLEVVLQLKNQYPETELELYGFAYKYTEAYLFNHRKDCPYNTGKKSGECPLDKMLSTTMEIFIYNASRLMPKEPDRPNLIGY